jgi:hypothetical protein
MYVPEPQDQLESCRILVKFNTVRCHWLWPVPMRVHSGRPGGRRQIGTRSDVFRRCRRRRFEVDVVGEAASFGCVMARYGKLAACPTKFSGGAPKHPPQHAQAGPRRTRCRSPSLGAQHLSLSRGGVFLLDGFRGVTIGRYEHGEWSGTSAAGGPESVFKTSRGVAHERERQREQTQHAAGRRADTPFRR